MYCLGEYLPGVSVDATLELHNNQIRTDGFLLYQLDTIRLSSAASAAWRNGLEVDRVYSNGLTGTINAPDGGWLYTSIPYDSGWKLTVDGRVIDTAEYAGALLCAYLPESSHRVTLRFTPPGLLSGAVVSAASAFACVVYWYLSRKQKNRRV